jgi:predicted GIY-YIG superfamily endonuclease
MKTHLYKLVSADDEVLYIGITSNFDQRMSAHANEKGWWGEVEHFIVKTFSTREDAEAEERYQIAEISPKYNEMLGVKLYPSRRMVDRRAPKTHAKLPEEEIEYLKNLSSDETYSRCAELQQAGWSVAAMLDGAKVSPTLTQLRVALKYKVPTPTGRAVPVPPKSKTQLSREYRETFDKNNYVSDEEKELIQEYASQSKKYRPQYGPNHPLYQAVEEYKELITELRDRGVLFSTIARIAGVDESNIRRRYIKKLQ